MQPSERFAAWVVVVGGPSRAADLLKCDAGHVVHIAKGRRRPGLGLAMEIERLTRRGRGSVPILARSWIGATVAPRRAA